MLEILLDILSECFFKMAENKKNGETFRKAAVILGGILALTALICGIWEAYVSGNDGQKVICIILLVFACVLCLFVGVCMRQRRREWKKKTDSTATGPEL